MRYENVLLLDNEQSCQELEKLPKRWNQRTNEQKNDWKGNNTNNNRVWAWVCDYVELLKQKIKKKLENFWKNGENKGDHEYNNKMWRCCCIKLHIYIYILVYLYACESKAQLYHQSFLDAFEWWKKLLLSL